MANTYTSSGSKVIGVVDDGAFASPAITVRGSKLIDFAFNEISGDVSAQVEASYETGAANAANWQTIAGPYTSDTAQVISLGSARQVRVAGTVTSGSAAFELTAGNREG